MQEETRKKDMLYFFSTDHKPFSFFGLFDKGRINSLFKTEKMFLHKSPPLLFVVILFIMGLIFGAVLVQALDSERENILFNYLNNFLVDIRQGIISEYGDIFRHAILDRLQQLGLLWLLSLSILGLPFLLAILFLQGVFLGFTTFFLIHKLAWKGFIVILIAVLPKHLLNVPVWLLMVSAGVSFSLYFIRHRFRKDDLSGFYKRFLLFSSFTLMLAAILLFSALLEAFMAPFLLQKLLPYVIL